ncbi:MAG: LCP family protein [Limnochordia bacterium]|jgi:LCP family protein required for cell wall assembly
MMVPPERLEEEHRFTSVSGEQIAVQYRRIMVYLAVFVTIVVLGAGLAYVRVLQSFRHNDRMVHLSPERRRVNVLLIGADTREEDVGRSDTLMLVSFDPFSGSVGLMSIPRDTRVRISGRQGYGKVNAAFAIGGPELAKQTVADTLGVRVDYYVLLDFAAFEKIVDALGGVTIDVPKRMYYVDRAQRLIIDLQPGPQRLDGRRALGYVRFRHDALGDISLVDPASGQYDGRVERQLQFVRAVVREITKPRALWRMPRLLRYAFTAVDTDMPMEQMVSLVIAALRVNSHSFHTYVLPGVGDTVQGVSYWIPDLKQARQVLDEMISSGEMLSVRVAILNASGVEKVADQAAERLHREGFEVVFVGNSEDYAERTRVANLGEKSVAAEVVAEALGVKVGGIRDEIRVGEADVAVIIGRDGEAVFAESTRR